MHLQQVSVHVRGMIRRLRLVVSTTRLKDAGLVPWWADICTTRVSLGLSLRNFGLRAALAEEVKSGKLVDIRARLDAF